MESSNSLLCGNNNLRSNIESCVKQEGQPFKTLGPQNSPKVVSWTMQVHKKTDVVALNIHNFIIDLEYEQIHQPTFDFSSTITFNPILLLPSSS